MTDSTQHRATPIDWKGIRKAAEPVRRSPEVFDGGSDPMTQAALDDLNARVEALEHLQSWVPPTMSDSFDAMADRLDALEATLESIGCAFDQASANLTARLETPTTDGPQIPAWHGAEWPRGVNRSLNERVGNVIPLLPDGRVDRDSARAAILAVADWLDSVGNNHSARELRKELGR